MEAATLQVIVSIAGLVIQHGAPAVADAIVALGKDTVTQEDIDALTTMIKPPDKY
jgi:hypothetical protein